MKKLFNASIVLALTSMLFFSCSKADELVVNDEDVLVKATLIAGNPQATPASKTQIDGTTPYWSVGDAIGVSDGATNQEFTTSITSPSTTATFTGETVSGELYAYYPYTSGGVSSSKVNIALPAEQNPTATSFDGRADVLVSKKFIVTPENTTVSGLQFKRLTSVLKVVIKNNGVIPAGEHPTFVSVEAGSNLIGTVQVDFAGQSMSFPSGSTKVTANYTSATQFEIDGTNAAYLVVVPQTLAEGTTLTLKANTENYYIEKNITVPAGGIEILEGKITTLGIGMSNSTVTHHPAINVTSDNPMAVPYTESTGNTISYSISDPLSGGTFSYSKDADWITITSSTEGSIQFSVAAQSLTQPSPVRTGHITLSYTDAPDVVVEVNQQAVYYMPATASSSTSDISINGIKWNFTAGDYSSCNSSIWTVGMKKGSVVKNMANSTTVIPFNVGNVVVVNGAKSDNSLTVNSMRIEVSSSSDFASVQYSVTSTGYAPNSSVTFTRPDNQDWTNKYFRIVYELSHDKGKEVNLEFKNALFTSK